MNREIKFRGQLLNSSEWVYGYYVKDPKGQHRIYFKPFDEASQNTYQFVKEETVCQLVISKNYVHNPTDQDIYEEDIIETYDKPMVVEFTIHDDEQGYFIDMDNGGVRILGNTIDNPELLNPIPPTC